MATPTPEVLKDKAKIAKKFLKEKCIVEVPHGHCIELVAKLYGFNDWNTASATLKKEKKVLPFAVDTVGELKEALASYKDSDRIDAEFKFKLSDLLNEIDEEDDLESDIYQVYSLSVGKHDDDTLSLELKLESEDMYSEETMFGRSLR